MKQTAIEWLVEQIIKEKGLVDLDIEQAKEMEKKQIIDAFDVGLRNGYIDSGKSPEQYYKEKFNK